VNYAVIAACTVAFLVELGAGARVEDLIHDYGLIPARFGALVRRVGPLHLELYVPFVTSMFLHAGWAHYAGNMLYLWIFGDNVEDRFGHVGYALFYLVGGVFAAAAHALANPTSVVPTIGASGAIAAVMGAYFVLYPRARISSLAIVFFWIRVVSVPAFVYLALWFALQLLAGSAALSSAPGDAGVAWWAHLGGFAFGAATVALLGRRRAPSSRR
jgi:membrane associated rhomboid family serine protease